MELSITKLPPGSAKINLTIFYEEYREDLSELAASLRAGGKKKPGMDRPSPLRLLDKYGDDFSLPLKEKIIRPALERALAEVGRAELNDFSGIEFICAPCGTLEISARASLPPEEELPGPDELREVLAETPAVLPEHLSRAEEAALGRYLDVLCRDWRRAPAGHRLRQGDLAVCATYDFNAGKLFRRGMGPRGPYELVISEGAEEDPIGEFLIGRRAGESVDVDTEFPKDFQPRALAGLPFRMRIMIGEVREPVRLPVADRLGVFPPGSGIGTEDDLRLKVRALTGRLMRKRLDKIRNKLLLNRAADLGRSALPADSEDSARNEAHGRAERVRRLVRRIACDEGFSPADGDLALHLRDAPRAGAEPSPETILAAVAWLKEYPKSCEAVKSEITENRVCEWLLKRVRTVTLSEAETASWWEAMRAELEAEGDPVDAMIESVAKSAGSAAETDLAFARFRGHMRKGSGGKARRE